MSNIACMKVKSNARVRLVVCATWLNTVDMIPAKASATANTSVFVDCYNEWDLLWEIQIDCLT